LRKLVLVTLVFGVSLFACNCKFDKEKVRCDYYVYKMHDKSHQKNCIAYADSSSKAKVYDKAAEYYLIGGDLKNARLNANKALKMDRYYVLEYLGMVELIENHPKKAQQDFKMLKQKVKNNSYVVKDIQTLSKLYPNFDEMKALELLK